MSTVQMEPTLRTVSPSRKSLLFPSMSDSHVSNAFVITLVNSDTYFGYLKKKKV